MNIHNILAGERAGRAMRGLLALCSLCLISPVAHATLITFTGASSSFTTPYTESGYVLTPLSGTFTIGFDEMNLAGGSTYIPGIGSFGAPASGSFELQLSSGAWFRFNGLDLGASPVDELTYTFTGELNGVTVASGTGTSGYSYPNFLRTYGYGSSATIETLIVSLYERPEDSDSSAVLDNINVTAIPDRAATLGLLAVGLFPLFALSARQRRLTAAT